MRPFKFFIELTYNCNLRCIHCYKSEDVSRDSQKFLSTKRVFRLFDEIEQSGAVEIYLTGGECFTHPDILPILRYAASKNFLTILLTNGNALADKKLVEKISSYHLHDVRISLYGDANTHDRLTKINGSYDKSIAALINLKKYMGIGTAVYVLTSLNYEAKESVFKFCAENDIGLSLSTTLFPTVEGDLSPIDLRITPKQYKYLAKKLNLTLLGTSCSAGISRFRITPSGDVNPCELMRGSVFGNIFVDKLSDILSGETRKQFNAKFSELIKTHTCNICTEKTVISVQRFFNLKLVIYQCQVNIYAKYLRLSIKSLKKRSIKMNKIKNI